MDRSKVLFRTSLRICLIAAPVLAAVMSVTTDFNRHPDEIHHFEAVRYYTNAFLPPEIGYPSVRDSYSVWGVSYLNYHWIEYLLAGKFVLIGSMFVQNDLVAARFFNVLLLAALCAFFLYRSFSDEDMLLPSSVLVVTPQVWYIFSYVNNDAFALAVGLVAALLVVDSKSALNRFLKGSGFRDGLVGAIGFGILLGLLLISKTNYYPFLIVLALWLLYQAPPVKAPKWRPVLELRLLQKYAAILLLTLSVLSIRLSLDFYVNGETNFVGLSYLNYIAGDFEKKPSRLLAYQEEIAEPPFKPSTIERDVANTHPGLRLKDKGAAYSDLFTQWRWHEISFKSAVGVYGYMTIFAPSAYYVAIALLYAAFAAYLLAMILVRRRRDQIVAGGILVVGCAITIFISSYLSWTYAFQAQGRYLFPVLPMVAMLLYAARDLVNRIVLTIFVLGCFALSVYSFLFVGVRRINSLPTASAPVQAAEPSPRIMVG